MEPLLASPPRATGRQRSCFSRSSWDPQDCRAGRAAGALRCRAVTRPAYLQRLLQAAGSACWACWKRPSNTWHFAPRSASAHPVSSQAAGAVWCGLLCIMCRSALVFFTATFVCLQKCRPGPAPFLRAAWMFSVVLFSFVFFLFSKVLGCQEEHPSQVSGRVTASNCGELKKGGCAAAFSIAGSPREARCQPSISSLV